MAYFQYMHFMSSTVQPFIDQAVQQAVNAAVALAASFGLSLPGLPPTPAPAPAPVSGSCDVSVIGRDIGVPQMNTVLYCDGQWARVNMNRTDWLLIARWDGHRWVNPKYDGTTWAGMTTGCYTHEHINRLGGAPDGLYIDYCEPGTSTLH